MRKIDWIHVHKNTMEVFQTNGISWYWKSRHINLPGTRRQTHLIDSLDWVCDCKDNMLAFQPDGVTYHRVPKDINTSKNENADALDSS